VNRPPPDRASDEGAQRDGSPAVGLTQSHRGQLVLLSGVVVALALLAMLAAFLQLGYGGDAATDGDDRVSDAGAFLQRVTHDAASGLRGEYTWNEREQAVRELGQLLESELAALERARAESGAATTASFNRTAAGRWAAANCPGGPARDFGPCRADDGVVVQERDGRTLVLAVAYDLTVATDRSTTRLTTVVEPVE